jgi:hypothetical protein
MPSKNPGSYTVAFLNIIFQIMLKKREMKFILKYDLYKVHCRVKKTLYFRCLL